MFVIGLNVFLCFVLLGVNKTGFDLIIFPFYIHGKLSIKNKCYYSRFLKTYCAPSSLNPGLHENLHIDFNGLPFLSE